jgi:hypothetical protein
MVELQLYKISITKIVIKGFIFNDIYNVINRIIIISSCFEISATQFEGIPK